MASYEKGKNGKWSVRFRFTENEKEVNKRLSGFTRKSEAERAYRDFLVDAERKRLDPKAPERLKFSEVYRAFQVNDSRKLRESTINTKTGVVDMYILPVFGDRYIAEIKPIEILEWQNGIDKSYGYLRRIRAILSNIFNFAERYYDIPSPMHRVEPPRRKEKPKEMQIFTEEEYRQFISAVDEPLYHCLFQFLYTSGVRIGECVALHKEDINIGQNSVTIKRSITEKGNKAQEETSPKNDSSVREIKLPKFVIDELLSICQKSEGQYVFFGKKPRATDAIRYKLRKYCEKAGVKQIRIHDFRHSCASLLLSHGASIVSVSKRLGHGNTQQTLNTYAHLMPRDEDIAVGILNRISGTD